MWSVNTMFAACPACKTVFPVGAAQLRAAAGRVRCGNCENVFVATEALFDDPREALTFAEQQLSAVSQEIDDLVDRALDGVPVADEASRADVQEDMAQEASSDETAPGEPENEATDLVDIALGKLDQGFPADRDTYAMPVASEFVSPAQAEASGETPLPAAALLFETGHASARTSWGAIAAALFLTALLLGQYAWAERYRLAGIPAFRPTLDAACAVLGCDLPLRHDTAKLEVLEREIRNHPHVSDALLVSATFENRADFVQAYPVFEVTFSDVSGTPVAARRFFPKEYLNGVDPSQGMPPGQQTRLMLEIVDPGDRAVSFQFDFL